MVEGSDGRDPQKGLNICKRALYLRKRALCFTSYSIRAAKQSFTNSQSMIRGLYFLERAVCFRRRAALCLCKRVSCFTSYCIRVAQRSFAKSQSMIRALHFLERALCFRKKSSIFAQKSPIFHLVLHERS